MLNTSEMQRRPLVVDLDGTLIQTDMLHEAVVGLLRRAPWQIAFIPLWLMNGKVRLKQKLSYKASFNPTSLPYNNDLIDWLKEQKAAGRKLILCTAAEETIAKRIAVHLGYFDEVMATGEFINLRGEQKAQALIHRFGIGGFDYIGNSDKDLPVWKKARRAIIVNAPLSLVQKTKECCEIERVFPATQRNLKLGIHLFRSYQWLKNLLLFVPAIAAHQLSQLAIWIPLLFAFLSFSACASAAYITNDLLDLENDRLHPRKCLRPFAAGKIPIAWGAMLVPFLFFVSLFLGSFINTGFLSWLILYFVLTVTYSFWLKRFVLVDCLILAGLYTLRIIAGATAVNLPVTFWLLGFSVFLFLSLAFVKRYTELLFQTEDSKVGGRGYFKADIPIVQMLGIASGYAAVIVLAFYINSDAVIQLYQTREFVWGAVPIMLFWINWVWIRAHRGLVHDDPLIFAIKDKVSLFMGALFALVLCLGTIG